MDRTRRPALDGLRALAALGVVVHHAWQYSGHPAPWNLWLQLSLGVALFFCLSGFLVYGPWASGRPPRAGRFYALRAARILPLYYLTLVVAVILLSGTGHWRSLEGWRLLGFLVFAQNYVPSLAGHLNPPSWTLAIEVSFYAVLPLIGLLARRRGPQLLVLAGLTAASVAWSALTPDPAVVRQTLLDVIGLFCAGMAARVLVEGRDVPRALSHALLLGGAALVWAFASGRLGGPTPLGTLPAGVGFAAIVVACSTPHAPRLLAARPLAYLGTLSYGIYLWHYPILLGLQAHGLLPHHDFAATCALVGLPAIALAAFTWHFLEQPVLRLARRGVRVNPRGGRSTGAPRAVPS